MASSPEKSPSKDSPPAPSDSGSKVSPPSSPAPSKASSPAPSKASSPPDDSKSSKDTGASSPPPPPKDSSPPPPSQSKSPPPPPSQSQSKQSPPPPAQSQSQGQAQPSQQQSGNQNNNPPPPPAKLNNGTARPTPASPKSNKGSGNKTVSGKTPSSRSSGKDNSVDTKIIIGVAAAVGLALLIMLICIICCFRKMKKKKKKKKKKDRRQVMYYGDPKGGGYNNYQNNYQTSPWANNQKVPEHIVKVSPSGAGGSNGGWDPYSQVPVFSDEASSNFSGTRQPPVPPLPPTSPSFNLGFNRSTFTYEELHAATNGFSQANLLGQGGFGYVHKGVFPNGKEVAIKSLKAGSGQGEREFQAEVEIISRVHHRYLVSLVGYCIVGGQRMLVYEYVPNKTLEYHLHGKDRPVMDFATRLRIALGASKGLAYLHEDCHPRIIHRDIKAANILIDNSFEAMVADFGLAKLSNDNNTHVSTRVMGTFGYMAPEYASSGKLTDRSDVFSFGVMLLELITGKQPIDISMDDSLVDWARPLLASALENGNFDELVDPRLEKNYNYNEMQRMIACAAASIRHSARKRPKMSQIVRILEGDSSLDDLNEGIKPGQSSNFGVSGEYSSSTYNADMQKFRQLALGSQEFESNDSRTSSGDNSREMRPAGVGK